MKITPLSDHVLVVRDEKETKTPGGILLPDQAKEKPQRGKVIAVGPGRMSDDGKLMPMQVNEGDRILFSTYAGNEVRIEGEDYLIMSQNSILAVLE
jgi:chaperonin GroES